MFATPSKLLTLAVVFRNVEGGGLGSSVALRLAVLVIAGLTLTSMYVSVHANALNTSKLWDASSYPWNKLNRDLFERMQTDSLPSRFVVEVYINVTERLLMGESVFVPNGLDPVIWNALTDYEKFILQDYWKRYENVPGDPVLAPEKHSVVIEKVLALIAAYNDNITKPKLESLIAATQTLPDVLAVEAYSELWAQSTLLEIGPSDLQALMLMTQVGHIALDRILCRASCFSLDVSVPTIGVNTVFWNSGYTGSGMKVGMLDTGVSSHPHLQLAASKASAMTVRRTIAFRTVAMAPQLLE